MSRGQGRAAAGRRRVGARGAHLRAPQAARAAPPPQGPRAPGGGKRGPRGSWLSRESPTPDPQVARPGRLGSFPPKPFSHPGDREGPGRGTFPVTPPQVCFRHLPGGRSHSPAKPAPEPPENPHPSSGPKSFRETPPLRPHSLVQTPA